MKRPRVRVCFGSEPGSMTASDERYVDWDSPGSASKAVNHQADVTSLGVRTHRIKGRRDSPENYLTKVIANTCWVLAQPRVPRKWLQILAGRWVRVFMRRSCLLLSFAGALEVDWEAAPATAGSGASGDRAAFGLLPGAASLHRPPLGDFGGGSRERRLWHGRWRLLHR